MKFYLAQEIYDNQLPIEHDEDCECDSCVEILTDEEEE